MAASASASGSPARNWCFTVFGDAPPAFDSATMQYLVFQRERCPKTSRLHFQGYVQLKRKVRMSGVIALLPEGSHPHVELAKGKPSSNRDYCTKAETRVEGPWEFGDLPGGQGTRTDLEKIAKKVATGTPVATVALEEPGIYVKYHRGLESLSAIAMEKSAQSYRSVQVFSLVGAPRTGKTLLPLALWGPGSVFKLNSSSSGALWFDGYCGQPVLLLDDFAGWIRYHELLVLLEGHPYRLPVKGSHSWALWKVVIITSNTPVTSWYSTPADQTALHARILYSFDYPEEKSLATAVLSSLPVTHASGYVV